MSVQDRVEEAKDQLSKSNPANVSGGESLESRKRIPMTLPQQRLAVAEIPGFALYWMKGTPERLQQAQQAGYEFVYEDEVTLNDTSLGGNGIGGGNTDLGARISRLASPIGGGETDAEGQPLRLYLMKQRLEWYEEDQRLLQDRNDAVVNALTNSYRSGTVGGQVDGETADDRNARYVDDKRSRIPDFFQRKSAR